MPCGQRPAWPSSFAAIVSGAGAQRAVGEQHARRQPLEQQRLVVRNAEMAQAALRVREGQREGARGRARVAILLRERLGGLAIRGDAGGEREAHRRARDQPDPLAQAEDRIEHDAGRARQRAAVERGRAVGVAAAADEARAIGLPFDRPLRPAFEAQHVHRPDRRLARVARPPMAEQRRAVGQVLGFEKQLAEGRMREIVGRRRQHDLGVAGDVDLADPRALVDHRHPADFDVVFGRDGDVELRRRPRRRGGGTSPARRGTRPGSRPARPPSDGRWPTRPSRSARRAGRRTGCPDRASGRAATASPPGRGRSCCRRRRW